MQGVYDNITNFNETNFTNWTMEGKPVEAVLGTLYNKMGGDYFFLFFFFFIFSLVYMKTRNMGITSMIMLIFTSAASAAAPAAMLGVMFIMISFSLAALLLHTMLK